ncbi:TIGR01777 family oxidoreductase [Flagellimonas onchidii]|uniref:TIGR01777 family oxidoreductase n=1 Tax=Flagellimonas onchidii TaxID=2562684 RepID=UPI0010A6AF90|nr:TIGR01777 family oxidoreductase [Allomuricauda onchidii]
MKKIVIAGGSGFLGNILIQNLKSYVEEIVVLSRKSKPSFENIRFIKWDGKTLSEWAKEIDDCTALINLSGRSVDCRYNKKNKAEILDSRINSTKVLGKAVEQSINPPEIWINSSTATIYRHSMDKKMNELTGELGSGFSVEVAKTWEKAFFSCNTPKTRKVALRTSIVLGKEGGALAPIKNLVKLGFGGKQGSGKQFVSWIHEKDFARSILFIIKNNCITRVINLVAPTPTTNEALMKKIRDKIKIPFGIPLSTSLLEMGARLINTETELILKSRNVIPKKLIDAGYEHDFGALDSALDDLFISKS